jgi:hypothetical protein
MAERKVYFHQVTDLAGNRFKPSFNGSAVLTALDDLVAAGDAEYAAMAGRVLVGKTVGQGRRGAHLALFLVREEDLPYLYNNGQFATLDAFISGGRVADPTYFGFFPNNVLAFVFNQSGPRPKALARYLSAKLNVELDFPVIPRPRILDTVAEAGEVKLVDVKIPTNSAHLLGDNALRRATEMLAETLQFADVEFVFRARTKADRERFTRRIQEVLPSWLDNKAALKKAQAVLGSDDTYSGDRPLNLLEDLIVFQADIDLVPGSRRYLEEADVMSELERAYYQVRGEIRRGLGGGA